MKIAIMGYGTVGSGVAEVIDTHEKSLAKSTGGENMEVARILDLRDFPGDKHEAALTKDFNDILNDKEIKVVAETMGGVNPAFDFTMKLLKAGKSVVTSNKELVAQKGLELLEAAKENGVNYLFEASVGGGIPIIRPLSQCFAANNIMGIAGILNGTTNFILTKMIEDGMQFDAALKLAQDLGFAERNPAADIEGHDACRKICILASLAFGKHVYPNFVHTEGITEITLEDVKYAEAYNCVIKLIGRVKRLDDGKIDIIVAPMFVPNKSQLANIDYEFNGIMVRGDCTGDVVFYGKGAGKLPTASAVVADVVDCCKHLKTRKFLFWADGNGDNILPYEESVTAMYIRANTTFELAQEVFGCIDKIEKADSPEGEIAFVTAQLPYGEIIEKIAALESRGAKVISKIRIGDL